MAEFLIRNASQPTLVATYQGIGVAVNVTAFGNANPAQKVSLTFADWEAYFEHVACSGRYPSVPQTSRWSSLRPPLPRATRSLLQQGSRSCPMFLVLYGTSWQRIRRIRVISGWYFAPCLIITRRMV